MLPVELHLLLELLPEGPGGGNAGVFGLAWADALRFLAFGVAALLLVVFSHLLLHLPAAARNAVWLSVIDARERQRQRRGKANRSFWLVRLDLALVLFFTLR
jgi:hypothetical protein